MSGINPTGRSPHHHSHHPKDRNHLSSHETQSDQGQTGGIVREPSNDPQIDFKDALAQIGRIKQATIDSALTMSTEISVLWDENRDVATSINADNSLEHKLNAVDNALQKLYTPLINYVSAPDQTNTIANILGYTSELRQYAQNSRDTIAPGSSPELATLTTFSSARWNEAFNSLIIELNNLYDGTGQ